MPSAPPLVVPPTGFVSVEYPGPLRSADAHANALRAVGGLKAVTYSVNQDQVGPDGVGLELNLRPDEIFSHPITGEAVATNNVLLRVVKRRRKNPRRGPDGTIVQGEEGVYSVEAVGAIRRTFRFRTLSDYQYQPDVSEPAVQLVKAMRDLDVQGVQDYRLPVETEAYETEGLRLMPPPAFARASIPQLYNFTPLSASIPHVSERNEEPYHRLVNKARNKDIAPIAISHASTDPVPDAAPPNARPYDRSDADAVIARFEELLQERPVWNRVSLLNGLGDMMPRNKRPAVAKTVLPSLTYTFVDGPFREQVVRFGYDPRVEPDARFCQRIMLRNTANVISRGARGSTLAPVNEAAGSGSIVEDDDSHIFDGETIRRNIGNFQMQDLTDELLSSLIRDERYWRTSCHDVDGWFVPGFIDILRSLLRRKFFALLNENQVVTADDCQDLIDQFRRLPREADLPDPSTEPARPVIEDEVKAATATAKRRAKTPAAPKPAKQRALKPKVKKAPKEAGPAAPRASTSKAVRVVEAEEEEMFDF